MSTEERTLWRQTWRADPRAARLADRHYSRQTVGSNQFTPPGRVLVLVTPEYDALWATAWPYARYVNRTILPDAWVCSLFRNEGPHLSSLLIRQAVAITRHHFGEPPDSGMLTMVDPGKVRPKRDPGRCFLRAGFVRLAERTGGGLLAFQLSPGLMPAARPPLDQQLALPLGLEGCLVD